MLNGKDMIIHLIVGLKLQLNLYITATSGTTKTWML